MSNKNRRGKGEGSIWYDEECDCWRGTVTVGYEDYIDDKGTPKKRQLRITYQGERRKDVAEQINTALAEKQKGTLVIPSELTVSNYLKYWMEHHKVGKLKAKTKQTYQYNIDHYIVPNIGDKPLQKLTSVDIQMMYTPFVQQGKIETVLYTHRILSGALKQAKKDKVIPHNIAEDCTLPKQVKKEMKDMSQEEAEKFLTTAKSHKWYAPFKLMFGVGVRTGELLALKWRNVDLDNATIDIQENLVYIKNEGLIFDTPKSESSKRLIPIPEEVNVDLINYKSKQKFNSDNDLVVCANNGNPIWPRNFAREYYKILKDSGLEGFRPHDIRHTAATTMIELNVSDDLVQAMLGHADKRTTSRYTHVKKVVMMRSATDKINERLKLISKG